MNEPPQPSMSSRSELVRFFGWLFSWRGLRRILIVLAWVATIIALLYGEENWRGRRAWNKYRREMQARGEQLDLKAFNPKPVPDEQNFAAIPFIEEWFIERTNFQKRWEDNFSRAEARVPFSAFAASNRKGPRQFIDLVAWQMAYDDLRLGEPKPNQKFKSNKFDLKSRAKAAPAVLEEMKTSETNLAPIKAASSRPYARYPVVYDLENPWGILLPHLGNVKAVCARLQVKACAELAAGQSEKAFQDLKLLLYLADSVKDEPVLISYLVRRACLQIAIQPIWEGLAEHRWVDAQLQELQQHLQQYDFLADLKRPLDGERAAGILTAELLFRHKYRPSILFDALSESPRGPSLTDIIGRIVPHGWYYQEQLNYCRLYDIQLAGAFDPVKKVVFPGQIESGAHEFERQIAGGRLGRTLNAVLHHQLLASLLLPSLNKLPFKAATGQVAADEAALACALERYRLANGQFPEKLEALTPQFIAHLPNDVFSGEPYKYHRTGESAFTLYSVGWNEKDDRGAPGKTLFDEKDGDWVWESAPAGTR